MMQHFQHDGAKKLLFDPKNINDYTLNEEHLLATMLKTDPRAAVGVHTGAFVYHANSYTLQPAGGLDKLGESNYPHKL